MPMPPPLLPEIGAFAALYRHINDLRNYTISLRPGESSDLLTSHGSAGVTHELEPGAGKGRGEDKFPRWG